MDIEFQSQEELYQRVKPALRAKEMELRRLGFPYIKEHDIWEYLKTSQWSKAKDLTLADIVHDILHLNNQKIDLYVKKSWESDKKEPVESMEII